MKSEPSEFSIADLERVGEYVWDGVRNYQVRNMFRDVMRSRDKALFYHSSCQAVGVVGEMEVVNPAVVDPTQFNRKSKYFDPKSTRESPRWFGPRLKYRKRFNRLVTLSELRNDGRFKDMILLRPGNRLSAFLLSEQHYRLITELGRSEG